MNIGLKCGHIVNRMVQDFVFMNTWSVVVFYNMNDHDIERNNFIGLSVG